MCKEQRFFHTYFVAKQKSALLGVKTNFCLNIFGAKQNYEQTFWVQSKTFHQIIFVQIEIFV
jgi:hypothetical protein